MSSAMSLASLPLFTKYATCALRHMHHDTMLQKCAKLPQKPGGRRVCPAAHEAENILPIGCNQALHGPQAEL
jgi:hypothetical protein